MSNKTHVFAVAVEKYQDLTIPEVVFAENDAVQFVDAWKRLGAEETNVTLLLSAQATQAAFKSKFKRFLGNVEDHDRIVIFYAGHGFAANDISYITAHDTQRGDMPATSISLVDILKQVRESRSKRVALFFDSCHSGLNIQAGMRSIYSEFSSEEFKEFCANSEFHVAFASCKADESSYPNGKFKHGIWSHCVIRALQGEETDALEKGCLITGTSLQGFLNNRVPRILRDTVKNTATQTPCKFGNSTKEFIIADVSAILSERASRTTSLGSVYKSIILRGEESGYIRRLSGFRKGHHVPDRISNAADGFVHEIGSTEIQTLAENIYKEIQRSFEYKRKDISFVCDAGSATITTPDFEVDIEIRQDRDDSSSYLQEIQVGSIRRPAVVSEDAFSVVFSQYCDTLVVDFSRSFDVEKTIGIIEDIKELGQFLDAEPDLSSFTLSLTKQNILIKVTSDSMALSLLRSGDLKDLFDNTQKAIAALSGLGVTLLLEKSR